MASGTTVFIPSNGANMIQMAPGLSSVAFQASGATPYPQCGAQQLGISTSAPQQVPQKGPLQRFLEAESKVLGAVQILIGLIHIGLGAVSLSIIYSYYVILPTVGGYPFWGGIFFITSGSLCVAAANNPNRGLVKSSVGLNITSAIMAFIGIILCLIDLICISNAYKYDSSHARSETSSILCNGFSSLFFLFSLLEFCITVSLAHFGCQATCCSADQPTVLYVPYQVIGGREVATEPNPASSPPTYDNVVTKTEENQKEI